MRQRGRAVAVSRDEFERLTRARILAMPRNLAAVGWTGQPGGWVVTGDSVATTSPRLGLVVTHLQRSLTPTGNTPPFWLFCCVYDGWRERNAPAVEYSWVDVPPDLDERLEWQAGPGELPRLSPDRTLVACFTAHQDDPSAVLLPEAHFLASNGYRRIRLELAALRRPWRNRRPRVSYAGTTYPGEFPPLSGHGLRQRLPGLVAELDVPVDVDLSRYVSRRVQLRNRYLLDLNGAVRTWDAWAWKLLSGSVVLSPASHWETRFTRAFEPWAHYVPLEPDLSDLKERIDWCLANDDECRQIAERSKRMARAVFDVRAAERDTKALLGPLLGLDG